MPTVICRRCCLIYLGERWPDEVYANFYEREYRIVDAMKASPEERYARQLARAGRIIDFCGAYLPGGGGAVLDVGASTGGLLQSIIRATGCTGIGIEPSVEESEFARTRGIDVRAGTLATIDFPPGSFDLVLLVSTIDHMFDPFGELRRIRALLKPEGYLFISIGDFVELAKYRPDPAQLDHLTYYTSATLRDLVQRVGFQTARWRADSYEEARLRSRDQLFNVGPWFTIEGVLRLSDEPILWSKPDWRSIKADFDAARRYHERRSIVQRTIRRALRYAGPLETW